jgi:hypothetical protein
MVEAGRGLFIKQHKESVWLVVGVVVDHLVRGLFVFG